MTTVKICFRAGGIAESHGKTISTKRARTGSITDNDSYCWFFLKFVYFKRDWLTKLTAQRITCRPFSETVFSIFSAALFSNFFFLPLLRLVRFRRARTQCHTLAIRTVNLFVCIRYLTIE